MRILGCEKVTNYGKNYEKMLEKNPCPLDVRMVGTRLGTAVLAITNYEGDVSCAGIPEERLNESGNIGIFLQNEDFGDFAEIAVDHTHELSGRNK